MLLPILLRRNRRARLERRADVAQRTITGLERDLLRRGQHFDLAADLLEAPQVVLLLPGAHLLLLMLFLFERRDGALEPFGGRGVGRRVFAQHVGVAAKPTPPRDHLFERLLRSNQLLQFGGERLESRRCGLGEKTTPFAVLERAGGVLESAVQRRRVLGRHRRQTVPLHLQLGDAFHGIPS